MSLYNTGTFVVQAGTTGKTTTDSFGAMKACVAKVLGGEGQPFYLDMAGDGILKGIDVVNMKRLFRFGSKQGSATTLIVDTDTYSIPSGTFAIQEVQLIDAAGKVTQTLEYVPWGQFNTLVEDQDQTGAPEFWTARNSYDTQKVQIYPIPDDATNDIKITYYQRISRPSVDSDVIDAPRELSEVLCTYGEYYMLRLRNKDNPVIYMDAKRRFDEQLADYVNQTEREPTETLQWVLAPYNPQPNEFDPLS